MPFPEGFPGHRDVQSQFSSVVVERPPLFVPDRNSITMDDLITPERSLAHHYQISLAETIGALGLLPEDGVLPISDIWQPHRNSHGQYFVEYEITKPNPVESEKQDLYHVYSYVLPPGMTTSIHGHDAFEFYLLGAGEFHLTLNGEEGRLEKFAIVGPGVEHTGRAGNQPALITAITYNPLGIPREHLHEYAWDQKTDWTQVHKDAAFQFWDELQDCLNTKKEA